MNLWHDQFDDPAEILSAMKQIRQAWPGVRFYANGMGYVVNRKGTHDREQPPPSLA